MLKTSNADLAIILIFHSEHTLQSANKILDQLVNIKMFPMEGPLALQ